MVYAKDVVKKLIKSCDVLLEARVTDGNNLSPKSYSFLQELASFSNPFYELEEEIKAWTKKRRKLLMIEINADEDYLKLEFEAMAILTELKSKYASIPPKEIYNGKYAHILRQIVKKVSDLHDILMKETSMKLGGRIQKRIVKISKKLREFEA